MFKKLKDKIAEEVKQSPRLQVSVQQLAQYSPFGEGKDDSTDITPSESNTNLTYSDNSLFQSADTSQFSIDDDEEMDQSKSTNSNFSVVDLNQTPRSRTNSLNSSTNEYATVFHPYSSSISSFHLPSDLESNASELDEAATFSGHLDKTTQDQLIHAYQRIRARYHKYKGRYSDVAKAYKEMERERDKIKTVLTETQDKALRRMAELKEQCQLETEAKRHLEETLQADIEEKDHVITTLKTKIDILKSGGTSDSDSIGEESSNADQQKCIELEGKLERLEALLIKSKQVIKTNKEKILQLQEEKDTVVNQLKSEEAKQEQLKDNYESERNTLTDDLSAAREEITALKQQEEQNALAMAQTKQTMHKELEEKETKNKTLTESVSRLTLENSHLQKELLNTNESLKHLQDSSEEEKKSALQELSRGKAAALDLLKREMEQQKDELVKEKEESWQKRYEELELTHKADLEREIQIAEEELHKKMDEYKEQLQMALDEKDLQKLATESEYKHKIEDLENTTAMLTSQKLELEKMLSESEEKENVLRQESQEKLETECDKLNLAHVKEKEELTKSFETKLETQAHELKQKYVNRIAELRSQQDDDLKGATGQQDEDNKKKMDFMIAQHEQQIEAMRNSYASLEQEKREGLGEKDNIIVDLQEKLQEFKEINRTFAEEIKKVTEEKETCHKNVEELKKIVSKKEENISHLEQEYQLKDSLCQESITKNKTLQEEIINLKNQCDIKEAEKLSVIDSQRETIVCALETKENELLEQRKKIAELEETSQDKDKTISSMIKQAEERATELSTVNAALESLQSENSTYKNQITDIKDELLEKEKFSSEVIKEKELKCSSLSSELELVRADLEKQMSISKSLEVQLNEQQEILLKSDHDCKEYLNRVKNLEDTVNVSVQKVKDLIGVSDEISECEETLGGSSDLQALFTPLQARLESAKDDVRKLKTTDENQQELISKLETDVLLQTERADKVEEILRHLETSKLASENELNTTVAKLKTAEEEFETKESDFESQIFAFKEHIRQLEEENDIKSRMLVTEKEKAVSLQQDKDVQIEEFKNMLECKESLVEDLRYREYELSNLLERTRNESEAKVSEINAKMNDELVCMQEKTNELNVEVDMLKAQLESSKIAYDDAVRRYELKSNSDNEHLSQTISDLQDNHVKVQEEIMAELESLKLEKQERVEAHCQEVEILRREKEESIETVKLDFQQKIDSLQKDMKLLSKSEENVKEENCLLNEHIRSLTTLYDDLKEEHNATKLEFEEVETTSKCLQEQFSVAKETEGSLLQEKDQMLAQQNTEIDTLLQNLQEKTDIERELNQKNWELTKKVQEFEQNLTVESNSLISELRKEVEDVKSKLKDVEQKNADLHEEMECLRDDDENIMESNQKLADAMENWHNAVQNSEKLQDDIKKLQNKISTLENEKETLDYQWQSKYSELKENTELKQTQLQKQLITDKESELNQLKNSQESLIQDIKTENTDLKEKLLLLKQETSNEVETEPSEDLEEKHYQNIKRLAKDFEKQLHDKEKEYKEELESAIEKQEETSGGKVVQLRNQLKRVGDDLQEKSLAFDDLIEKHKEEMSGKDLQIQELKKFYQSQLQTVEQTSKKTLEGQRVVLQSRYQDELEALTSEWQKERLVLEKTAHDSLVSQEPECVANAKNSFREKESNNNDNTFNNLVELEYLRNILYQYMMGKEPLVLAKVLATVVKFNKKQTDRILQNEEQKLGLLHSRKS